MTNRLLLASLAALLGLVKPATAQDSTIQIRAVLNDPSNPEAKFYVGKVGETMTLLKLAEEGLTDSQKVTVENGSLNLFTTPTVDKNNPQAGLAATVKIPAGPNSLIVIILPAPHGTPSYRMMVLDDDVKSFPWGESKAVNLTSVDFALEVGGQKILLPGGKITPVPKVTKLDEYNRAQTNFYYKQEDQWVVAAERQMQYSNMLRRVFLIYKLPNALAPDVRTIVDTPPPVFDKAH
ncbi:MAG: hypothetical protein ABIS50_14170 [Luteolibacter sp.]|uniref:hypothetical protein n=1 Tax=Luteolibacter sp. TaxID=1962973 RepID=UPI0032671E00